MKLVKHAKRELHIDRVLIKLNALAEIYKQSGDPSKIELADTCMALNTEFSRYKDTFRLPTAKEALYHKIKDILHHPTIVQDMKSEQSMPSSFFKKKTDFYKESIEKIKSKQIKNSPEKTDYPPTPSKN